MRTAKRYVVYRTSLLGPVYWTGTGYSTYNVSQAKRVTLSQAKALRNRIDAQSRSFYGYDQAPSA